jgi:hypothetical protein
MQPLSTLLIALICVLSASHDLAIAGDAEHPKSVGTPADGAPEELEHFRNLIGNWSIQDWTKTSEGEWTEGPGADWDFWYAMKGWAVQDLCVRPGMNTDMEDPSQRFIGTNIRVWDSQIGKWKMSWIFNQTGAPQAWEATSTPEEIAMTFTPPGTTEPSRRVRFYNMTGTQFDWHMQALQDGNWNDVYRLKGTRKAAP